MGNTLVGVDHVISELVWQPSISNFLQGALLSWEWETWEGESLGRQHKSASRARGRWKTKGDLCRIAAAFNHVLVWKSLLGQLLPVHFGALCSYFLQGAPQQLVVAVRVTTSQLLELWSLVLQVHCAFALKFIPHYTSLSRTTGSYTNCLWTAQCSKLCCA